MATTRRLYLMRHGDAGEPPAWSGTDDERPLSGLGRTRSRQMAMRLKKMGVSPGLVIASPLVRARQTAEIAGKALGVPDLVAIDERVGPGFDITAVRSSLAEFGGVGDLLLVGHEPSFSSTVSDLIGGGEVVMKKGAVARIDVSRPSVPRGRLAWLLTPATL